MSGDSSYSGSDSGYGGSGSGDSPSEYTSQLDTISSEAYWSSYGHTIELQNSLYQNLTRTANLYKALRPTMPTEVMPFFTIIKTLGLTNEGILSITGILLLNWVDPRLSWNHQNYSINQFNMVLANMWYPPLILLNSASPGAVTPGTATTAQLLYTGLVSVNIPSLFTSSCTLDLSDFPYDSQTCSLILASLDSNGTSPGITFLLPNTTELPLDFYYQTGDFTLNGGVLVRGKLFCSTSCYSTIRIVLDFTRRSSYYTTTVIIPAFLLTFLLAFALILPSDNSIKINVACTLMLSLYTLQQNVARALPATDKAPFLSLGMLSSLVLAASCVLCTIICVITRMLQPQIGKNLGNHLDKLSWLIFIARNASKATAFEMSSSDTFRSFGDLPDSTAVGDTKNVEDTTGSPTKRAMLTLLEQQTSTITRTARDTAEKIAKDCETSRRWRTLDTLVNVTLLFFYLITAVVCLSIYDLPRK